MWMGRDAAFWPPFPGRRVPDNGKTVRAEWKKEWERINEAICQRDGCGGHRRRRTLFRRGPRIAAASGCGTDMRILVISANGQES